MNQIINTCNFKHVQLHITSNYLKICNKTMNYTQFQTMEFDIYDSVRRQSKNVIQSGSNQRTKSLSLLGIHNNKLVSKQDDFFAQSFYE